MSIDRDGLVNGGLRYLADAGCKLRRTLRLRRKADGLYLNVNGRNNGHAAAPAWTHEGYASVFRSADDLTPLVTGYMAQERLLDRTSDYEVVEGVEFLTRVLPFGGEVARASG